MAEWAQKNFSYRHFELEEITIFRPCEVQQLVLPDKANCLSVEAFLRMCNLKYEIAERKNAEGMSPSGRVPFIKCSDLLISELEPIVGFVKRKGISLTAHLDQEQMCEMMAYKSLVGQVLSNVENYLCWVDKKTYSEVTRVRYGSVHPWPLNWFMPKWRRQRVRQLLDILGWLDKSVEQMYKELDTCCQALCDKLGTQKYLFGDRPTEVDALLFGHMYTIMTTPLPDNRLAASIECFPRLVAHCKRIELEYFTQTNL